MRASIAHAGPLPTTAHSSSLLVAASNVARWAAQASFYALIVLMPLRARIPLELREPANVWDEYTSFFLYWSDFALIGVLSFWLLSQALHRRTVWFGTPLLRWSAAGFLLVVWLTSAFSMDAELSAYSALRLTGVMLLALYLCNEFDSLTQVLPAVALLVLSQSGVALAQFFQQHGLGLASLSESPYQDPFFPGASIVWTPGEDPLLRAYGLTEHPNVLGGILAASLLLLLPAAASRRAVVSVLVTAAFVAGAAALLVTFSRGAILGAALGGTVAFGLLLYRRFTAQFERWLIVCLMAGVVCAFIAGAFLPYLGARVNPLPAQAETTESRSIAEREVLIRATADVFAGHALTGVGAGALPAAMSRELPDLEYTYQPAHNVFMTVLAETGVAGATLFALLLLSPWALLWHRRRHLTPGLIATAGAVLAVTVAGMFDYYPWGLQPGRLLTWLTFGAFALAYRSAQEASASRTIDDTRGLTSAVSSRAGS